MPVLKESIDFRSEYPVFITGIPRSGTTLIYSTLLKHSAFRPQLKKHPKVSLYIESNAFMNPQGVFSSERADKYLLMDKVVKDNFLDSVRGIRPYQSIGNFIYRSVLRRNLGSAFRKASFKIGLNHIILRRYFYHAKLARNVKRVIEKTPDHITRIPEIKATYPNAKYIFLYRHPVDVFSSYRKRLRHSETVKSKSQKTSWLKISVENFCELYRKYIDLALEEQANNPDNFLMLKFEDVTNDPFREIREVCGFLGEAFEERMISEDESPRTAKFSNFLGGKIVKTTKVWQEFLNKEDALFVESVLSDLMTRLNYSRHTTVHSEDYEIHSHSSLK